ncbi:MAG: hypothetical protein AAB967_03535, partial [Patescibacteria group bacterium]
LAQLFSSLPSTEEIREVVRNFVLGDKPLPEEIQDRASQVQCLIETFTTVLDAVRKETSLVEDLTFQELVRYYVEKGRRLGAD